jgi:hypothetical protein
MKFVNEIMNETQAYVIPKGTEVLIINTEKSIVTHDDGLLNLPYDLILKRKYQNSTFCIDSCDCCDNNSLVFSDFYGNIISVPLEQVGQVPKEFVRHLKEKNSSSSNTLFESNLAVA